MHEPKRWMITSAYAEHVTGDPECRSYRVGETVTGPEQREPVEVVPATEYDKFHEIVGLLISVHGTNELPAKYREVASSCSACRGDAVTAVGRWTPPSVSALAEALRTGDVKAVGAAEVACLKEERDHYREQLAEAVEALQPLRAAWNEHMKTCPQHTKVPSLEEIDAWMQAPSNTASISVSPSRKTNQANTKDPPMVTNEMIELALPVFKMRSHEQPTVRPEKWDDYDRAAVQEILAAALATED